MRRAFKRPPRRRAAVLASGRRRLRASLAGRELGFITTSTQTSLLLTTGLARGGKGGEGGGATLHVPAPRPPAALLANSLKPPRSAANPKISNYNPGPQRLANSRPPRQIPRFQITIPAPAPSCKLGKSPNFKLQSRPPAPCKLGKSPNFNLQSRPPAPSCKLATSWANPQISTYKSRSKGPQVNDTLRISKSRRLKL